MVQKGEQEKREDEKWGKWTKEGRREVEGNGVGGGQKEKLKE
jgi:hypothetical protein